MITTRGPLENFSNPTAKLSSDFTLLFGWRYYVVIDRSIIWARELGNRKINKLANKSASSDNKEKNERKSQLGMILKNVRKAQVEETNGKNADKILKHTYLKQI